MNRLYSCVMSFQNSQTPYLKLSKQDINILAVLAHEVIYIPLHTGHAIQNAIVVYHLRGHSCVNMVTYL